MSTENPYQSRIPAEILALTQERDLLRRRGQYDRADLLKQQIEKAGFVVKDHARGTHLVTLPSITIDSRFYPTIREVPSALHREDQVLFSVIIIARNSLAETQRCVQSLLNIDTDHPYEIYVVDNSSRDGISEWLEETRATHPILHTIQSSRTLGAADAYNLGCQTCEGTYILFLDTFSEVTGDIFTPLLQTFSTPGVTLTGLSGQLTDDLRHFETTTEADKVEVINHTCLAFPRAALRQTGLFDTGYRFSLYMDVDFSFTVRDLGGTALLTHDLPVTIHPGKLESGLSSSEEARLSKRNFYRFLSKWGQREDLLLDSES